MVAERFGVKTAESLQNSGRIGEGGTELPLPPSTGPGMIPAREILRPDRRFWKVGAVTENNQIHTNYNVTTNTSHQS